MIGKYAAVVAIGALCIAGQASAKDAAMAQLSAVKGAVMVMAEDPAVRTNRLRLLARLRGLFLRVADISLLPSTGARVTLRRIYAPSVSGFRLSAASRDEVGAGRPFPHDGRRDCASFRHPPSPPRCGRPEGRPRLRVNSGARGGFRSR